MKKIFFLFLFILSLNAENIGIESNITKENNISYMAEQCMNYNSKENCQQSLKLLSQDKNKSIKLRLIYTNKLCDLNDSNRCKELGDIYYKPELNQTKNYKKAKIYFEKSCELNNSDGCIAFGLLYEYGNGVDKNLTIAQNIYKKACDLGENLGCDSYKNLKYIKDLNVQCKNNNSKACVNLGFLEAFSDEHVNIKKVKQYFKKACDLGNKKGCDAYKSILNGTFF